MFVRKKATKSGDYYYLVETYRENGKVRQKVLYYLGEYKTPDEEIAARRKAARISRCKARRERREADQCREWADIYRSEGLDKINKINAWFNTGVDPGVFSYVYGRGEADEQSAQRAEEKAARHDELAAWHDDKAETQQDFIDDLEITLRKSKRSAQKKRRQ